MIIKSKILLLSLFLLSFALLAFPAGAQEEISSKEESSPDTVTFEIIVETDDEKPIPNTPITCRSIVNSFDSKINEVEVLGETTNEEGKVELSAENSDDLSYRCTTDELITEDGCWYFPGLSSRFFTSKEAGSPIYIVGLRAESTCNTDVAEYDKEQLAEMYLQETPPPFKNSHVQPTPPPTPEPQEDLDSLERPTAPDSVFEWILQKIRSLLEIE